jgi:hypothetical protein
MNGQKSNYCTILVGKQEGKRPLVGLKYNSVDNIKMDLKVLEWGDMNLINLAQNRNQWRALMNIISLRMS